MHSSPASPIGSSRVAGLDVDDLHVGVGDRQADRARLAARELRRRVRDRRRFRQSVAFVQRPADPPLELLDHLDRTRRAAAVERAARARGRTRRPADGSAATRTPSARRGSRSAGNRGSRQHLLDVVLRNEDLQRADPEPVHHADGERVDVEVRDDEQVALVAARVRGGTCTPRSARRSRRCCRASASRPSACRSCRRCTAARRDRRARSRRAAGPARPRASSRSASDDRAVDRGGGRRGRRVLRQRRDDDRARCASVARTPSASGASASSVISIRMPESVATISTSRARVARVDVDDDRAEPQHGERRDDVLRTVGQHDADAIALRRCRARASDAASASARRFSSR